jgi:hypothetical protein
MQDDPSNPSQSATATLGAEDIKLLPVEQLRQIAAELGLSPSNPVDRQTLIESIRQQREILQQMDLAALREVVAWGKTPAPADADKETLVRQIATIRKWNYHRLSHSGLVTLARLRGISIRPGDTADRIIDALRTQGSIWGHLRRKRRAFMASLIGRVISGHRGASASSPTDEQTDRSPARDVQSLKTEIVQHGVVRGLASTIRGVTDDYIQQKLDEIEERIDRKLDEIDQRLKEWRDREIANRLRIIKITLIASILVAVLSFGYSWVKWRVVQADSSASAKAVAARAPAETQPGTTPATGTNR